MAETRTPQVGDRYVGTDNAAAAKALGLPLTVRPLMFVRVDHVFPEARKATVCDGDLWVSFDALERHFRLRAADREDA